MAIALDDAAQALTELTELARLTVDQTMIDIKLIISIRAVDREATARALARFQAAVAWIDLEELSITDATRIAKLECPALSVSDAHRLARAFGSNLFLLRAAAQQVQCGEQPRAIVNDASIRRLVAMRLIEETERHLSSLPDRHRALQLLSEVALNAPIPFNRVKEEVALATLHHAGVLRRVGDTLRFRRDVEGDLLLAYLLEQAAERATIEHLFAEQTGGDELQRQLRNLSAAGRGYAATMIRELTQRWLAEPVGTLSQRVRLLPYCADAAPEQVAEICVNAAHARELTANDIASIILALGRSDATRGLRLVWELAAIDSAMPPLPVYKVINELLNPYFHGPEELTATCEILRACLRDPCHPRRAEVLAEALLALFMTVATWDTNDGASFTMHEHELPAAPSLLGVRRAATQLLGEMLAHSDVEARTRAVEVLARHGAPHLGRVSTRVFDLAAADEFQSLIPTIEARLTAETETHALTALYTTLATRWAAGWPGGDDAGRLLVGRRLDPVVKAYQYGSRCEWFYSFDEAFTAAPERDRWQWWVHRHLHSRSDAECARVVTDLCAVYRTTQEVAECLSTIAGAERPERIIDAWCQRERLLFEEALSMISNARTRNYVENALRREQYRVDPDSVVTDLQRMPQPLSLDDVNVVLNTSNRDNVAVAVAVARHLVGQPEVAVRRRGLDCIQHRDDADPVDALDVLEHALRDGDWGHHWDAILAVLQKANRILLIGERAVLRQRIEERLVAGKEWVGDEWHEERVLEILYGEDHERRLDLLGRLLAIGSFGAIQEVGRLVAPLATDPAQIRRLVDSFVRWARDLGEGGLDSVESVLAAALNDQELPDETMAIAMEMLRNSEAVERCVALILLTHIQAAPEACATISRIAADRADGLQQRAVAALWSFRWPGRGWSRAIGEPPQKLVRLEQVLRKTQQLVSGDARGLVAEVLRAVEQGIAAYVRQDEEVLLPH